MGVISAISKALKKKGPKTSPQVHVIGSDMETSDASSTKAAVAELRPDEPVAMDANGIDDEETILVESMAADMADRDATGALAEQVQKPRSKQELIAELSKSYNEVVALIRKVDDHLDRQDRRSERLLEISEKLPDAVDRLSEIRDQSQHLSGAVGDLTSAIRDSSSRQDQGFEAQLGALQDVQGLLKESGEIEREVGESIREFKTSVGDMASSNDRLGEVLDSMQKRDSMRDVRLQEMVERTQRWTLVLIILCGVGVAACLVVALFAINSAVNGGGG